MSTRHCVTDLEVLFPYDYVYKEQYQYMCELKVTSCSRTEEVRHCLRGPFSASSTESIGCSASTRFYSERTLSLGDADRNGKDGDSSGANHLLPIHPQRGWQADLLYAYSPRDDQGLSEGIVVASSPRSYFQFAA